jgi:c-di-GMP-binding flagellar brake protein YcgR
MLEHVHVGEMVEIELVNDRVSNKKYTSYIERIDKVNVAVMSIPILNGQLVKLPVTEKYKLSVYSVAGLFSFEGKIIKYVKEDTYVYMYMQILTKGEKVQNREFFRFMCLMPLVFTVLKSEAEEENTKQTEENNENDFDTTKKYEGIIKDLGGGGFSFVSTVDIPMLKRIRGLMVLKDEHIIIYGTISRKQMSPTSHFKHSYGVKLEGLTEETKEKIIRFIFSEQRKSLKRT